MVYCGLATRDFGEKKLFELANVLFVPYFAQSPAIDGENLPFFILISKASKQETDELTFSDM